MKKRSAPEECYESNNQMAATLSAVTDGVAYVKNGRITQINSTMSRFLGMHESDVIDQKIGDAIMSFPSIEEALVRLETDNHVELLITGASANYNCLMNIKQVDEEGTSFVMIFTETEEIQMLAQKISRFSAYFTFDSIIGGKAYKMKEALRIAKKAAGYNFTVVIEGEHGTGKEMLAQAIHNAGSRRLKPFISVDCSAIPHELMEAELFGTGKGMGFPLLDAKKTGKFEMANGGTIFLDEIAELPIELQSKMLRLLQDEKITRAEEPPIPLDVRVIVASGSNLAKEAKNGNFRQDLYYRLNVVSIKLPSLKERREDIPILVQHFLQKCSAAKRLTIDKKAEEILERYPWPGNVRQLHNVVERSAMMCDGEVIRKEHFPLDILSGPGNSEGCSGEELGTLDEIIRRHVTRILDYTGGNISETARILNISRSTIYNYLTPKED